MGLAGGDEDAVDGRKDVEETPVVNRAKSEHIEEEQKVIAKSIETVETQQSRMSQTHKALGQAIAAEDGHA